MSAATHPATHHTRDHARHSPLVRVWRALFAAWDEPRPGSPILAGAPEPANPRNPSEPPDPEGGSPRAADLPPAPLYFGYDDAEAALLRLLDETAANALDLEERQSSRAESTLSPLEPLTDRRAS